MEFELLETVAKELNSTPNTLRTYLDRYNMKEHRGAISMFFKGEYRKFTAVINPKEFIEKYKKLRPEKIKMQ